MTQRYTGCSRISGYFKMAITNLQVFGDTQCNTGVDRKQKFERFWFWRACGFGPSEDGSPGRLSPERDLNAEESSTNEPHQQTSVIIGTCFSCRARGSNPGPPDTVILQWSLHHQHTAVVYFHCLLQPVRIPPQAENTTNNKELKAQSIAEFILTWQFYFFAERAFLVF